MELPRESIQHSRIIMGFSDLNPDDSEYFFERNETDVCLLMHAAYCGRLACYLPFYQLTECEEHHQAFEEVRRAWRLADVDDMMDTQRLLREHAHDTDTPDADALLLEVLGELLN